MRVFVLPFLPVDIQPTPWVKPLLPSTCAPTSPHLPACLRACKSAYCFSFSLAYSSTRLFFICFFNYHFYFSSFTLSDLPLCTRYILAPVLWPRTGHGDEFLRTWTTNPSTIILRLWRLTLKLPLLLFSHPSAINDAIWTWYEYVRIHISASART